MNEHLESSDHAVLALFQQQVTLLHLGRHQLTIEVTLHGTAAQDISNKLLPDEASQPAAQPRGPACSKACAINSVTINSTGLG